jgi:hypothetical protein
VDKSTLRAALDSRQYWGGEPDTLPIHSALWNAASMLEKLLPGECPECGGKGSVVALVRVTSQGTSGATQTARQTCPSCNGSGKVWDEDLIAAVRYCVPDEYPNGPPEAVLEEIVKRLTDKSVGNG